MDKGERIRVNDHSTIKIGDWVVAEVFRPHDNRYSHIHGEIVDIKYPVFRVKYMVCRFIDFLFEDVDRTVFVGEDRHEIFEHRNKTYLIPARGNGKSRESLKQLIEYIKDTESYGGVTIEEVPDVTDDEMYKRAWRLREELNKIQDESPKKEEFTS